MNTTQLLQDISSTKEAILNVINAIGAKDFNTVPFEGSWTAGQVADHINKATSGLQDLPQMTTAPTDTNPEAKVPMLKEIFLDMETKFKSPDFVLPSDGPHDKDALAQNIAATWDAASRYAQELDLSPTVTSFELPGVGHLTRWEHLYFGLYHTQRHAQQLQRIHKAIYGN